MLSSEVPLLSSSGKGDGICGRLSEPDLDRWCRVVELVEAVLGCS